MDDTATTTVPREDREYYDSISFWNYFAAVYRRLNARATGDPDAFWWQALQRDGRHFTRGLILNCGNGWVERDLLRAGLVEIGRLAAVAVDGRQVRAIRTAQPAAERGHPVAAPPRLLHRVPAEQ